MLDIRWKSEAHQDGIIPTLQDKILQRAVLMVLEPVYEQDFLNCSFGFRPDRGPHQALQALWDGVTDMRGAWVIDLDIQGFIDSGSPARPHLSEPRVRKRPR